MKRFKITYSLIDEEFSYQHHEQIVFAEDSQKAREMFNAVREDILVIEVKEIE